MDFVGIAEFGILLLGVYHAFYIYSKYYSTIRKSQEMYKKLKTMLRLALIGAICLILSFQVYYFTSFYQRHKILDIFIKLFLLVCSIVNQMFMYDYEEQEFHMKNKRRHHRPYITEGNISFKVINRLFLLYLVYKFFNRNT